MSDRTWRDSWVAALHFYDSLSGPGWTHIAQFRQLVSELAASTESRGLTVVTSHEVLTISPYTRYPDWFDGRRVILTPLPSGDVRIEYRPAGTANSAHVETAPMSHASTVVIRYISEL